jgi:hypothetical protein
MKKKLSSLTAEVRCGLGKVEWLSLRSTRSGPDADADARPSSWRMKLKSEKRCSQRLSMTLSKWWRCPSGRIWYLISLGVVKHLGSWHWQLVRSGCQTLVSWWLPQIPTFYPTLIGNYSHPLGESLSNLSTNQHHYVSLVFFSGKGSCTKGTQEASSTVKAVSRDATGCSSLRDLRASRNPRPPLHYNIS